jgi:uncharacterized protein YqeY
MPACRAKGGKHSLTESNFHPDFFFEPTGREPELPGFNINDAPMLGGAKRLWPSIAAHLLSEQHRAHRAGNMERVWVIRGLRARIQKRLIRQREECYLSGRPPSPLTEEEALAEMQAEREEVLEELEQAHRWLRFSRAQELRQALGIINEYIEFWQARLDSHA